MKKGDLIRKCLSNGIPYGPYMIVASATKNKVKALPVNIQSDEMDILIKERIYKVNVASLLISSTVYQQIIKGRMSKIYHQLTKSWVRVLKMNYTEPIEVICLYTLYGDKAYFKIEELEETRVAYERMVKIVIGERIL